MAIEAQSIFDKAMSLMDELDSTGDSTTTDTQEYVYRTPGILNILSAECRILCGITGTWAEVEALDDSITGLSDNLVRAAFPYGLAANLLIDENPTAASYFQQRYEELRDFAVRNTPSAFSEIEDLYGIGTEYNDFGRW